MQELECDYIEFNLIQSPELVPLLSNYQLIDDMVTNLSLFTDKPFIKGKAFIFINEIQEFKEIATKVKFWVDEGSYRYVFSGSLLGVELKNITSAPVGYILSFVINKNIRLSNNSDSFIYGLIIINFFIK